MRRPTKEHYKILQIPENADLDEIKKAYRKRAFELHPDLNPQNANANADFQLLNEAYVILIDKDKQDSTSKAEASAKYQSHQKQGEETKGKPGGSSHRKDQAEQDQRAEKERKAAEEAKKAEEKKAKEKEERPKSEKYRRTYAKNPFHARKKASAAYSSESNKAQSRVHNQQDAPYSTPSQEEVISELLKDDFARRVYEDIYSSLEQNKPTTKNNNNNSKFVQIDWSKIKPNIDFSNGVGGAMKNWLRKQIDDELEYRLPVSNLYPGSKVRLQIGQGISNETRTIDLTLPKDFVIGKPVRLTGLGKKIGKLQGDLYLTLLPSLKIDK